MLKQSLILTNHNINIIRTTYNKLNNHALVFIEITKAWLFFIIIITKLANKAKIKDFVAEVDFTLVRDDLSSRSNCETIGADR